MSSTKWVKGELIETLDSASVDPRGVLAVRATSTLFERGDWFARILPSLGASIKPLVARASGEQRQAWLFLTLDQNRNATALANWYSFAWGPIIRGEADHAQRVVLLRALAKRLRSARNGPLSISVAPVPRKDGSARLLREAFGKAGWASLRHQSSTSWTVETRDKSFAQYWAERPGQLRNTHDRKRKKFAITAEVLTNFDPEAWAAYEAVYADSWKPREGDSAFLRALAEQEAAAGCLRLGLARIDGEVVAAQFWTVENGIAYIHKLAHRESAKHTSAGTILSAALFAHVIDQDQVAQVDFGTGNDRYKADWMDASAPLDTIRFYNIRHPLGLARWVKARISALVRGIRLD